MAHHRGKYWKFNGTLYTPLSIKFDWLIDWLIDWNPFIFSDEISDGGDVSDEEESSGDDAPVSNNPFALLADD